MSDFPYASTEAARMLSEGLRTAAAERGLSVRQAGKLLDYKQAVVLSHMANGRVPIPIDRALDIAEVIGLPAREFLVSVLEQRHKEVNWGLITGIGDDFVGSLEALAGRPLAQLSAEHRAVMRDVVVESKPSRRWLTLAELPLIDTLRSEAPLLRTEGVSARQKDAIQSALRRIQ